MNPRRAHVPSAAARLRNLALGLLLLPTLGAPATARSGPLQVGEVATFAPNDVVVSGNLAFVTSGWGTGYQLSVVDVSDPTNPTLLSTLPLTGRCQGIGVSGSTTRVGEHEGRGDPRAAGDPHHRSTSSM